MVVTVQSATFLLSMTSESPELRGLERWAVGTALLVAAFLSHRWYCVVFGSKLGEPDTIRAAKSLTCPPSLSAL